MAFVNIVSEKPIELFEGKNFLEHFKTNEKNSDLVWNPFDVPLPEYFTNDKK